MVPSETGQVIGLLLLPIIDRLNLSINRLRRDRKAGKNNLARKRNWKQFWFVFSSSEPFPGCMNDSAGKFIRTRGHGEKSISWRSMNNMNSIRSGSRTISFLMRTLILTSHASFAPFVLYEPIIFFLSGHLYKISQQSHTSGLTGCRTRSRYPGYFVKAHKKQLHAITIRRKVLGTTSSG